MRNNLNSTDFDKISLSERKYERLCTMIFSCIPSSILMFDRNLRVIIANKNFLEKSRRAEYETVGKHVDEIFPSVILQYTRLSERIRTVFETGIGDRGREMYYRSPGLPTRVYYYNLTPLIDDQGIVESVMLIMDDITQQVSLREKVRQTERHLAGVVESANDVVTSLDSRGMILTWNNAAERISGYIERELVSKPLTTICVEAQKTTLVSIIEDLSRGKTVKHIELGLKTKTGKIIPISWSFALMRDDAQAVVGIVGVGQDLAERRELEAQLFHSAKLASLGVMAGGIAHEIRNPLGISSAAAQLLLEYPENETLRKECAQKIYSGIKRASQIIEELLKFSRPSEGRFELTNINDAVMETLTLIEKQLVLMRIEIKKNLDSHIPVIESEKNLLKQAFLNMFLNAANAMPDGGALTITTATDGKNNVLITFKDTGCGISSENVDKIFDPFFTTMPVGKGTGLGLSITYSIIKHHEGNINVESVVGKGTTFTIRLPIKKS
ncbi:MAG TPA: ATP-binding protein [Candidatus Wunengus sp. YC60]|uniref:ATP-binding protein n=1 Tax=Candidatus Wunengus sp. YC60 TaxID=3367697 RepID=UPI004026FBE2